MGLRTGQGNVHYVFGQMHLSLYTLNLIITNCHDYYLITEGFDLVVAFIN